MRSAPSARKSRCSHISLHRILFILIESDVHKDLSSSRMEKLKLKAQILNKSVRPHFNSVFDLQINLVINRKVISLHKVIKYVKRSNYKFFVDFSAKHKPCEPLIYSIIIIFSAEHRPDELSI